MYNTPYAFSMPNPLKNLDFKNEFSISSRIFLQKVAQKIEQKTAEQAHMTINQYLIIKGAEIILLLGIEACVRYTKKRLFLRGYRCHYGGKVGALKFGVYLRRIGICLTPRFVVRNVLRYGHAIMMEQRMTEEELRAWLKRPEGEGLEFKRAEKEVSDTAYKTACAFANTNGGWLIFGVADEGLPHEITGIDPSKIDKVQNDFLSELNNGKKLNIRIEATSHHHEIDGKHVLAFRIPEAQRHEKPVYLGGHPKNSYFRRGASNVQMQEHQWQNLLYDANAVPWDNVVFEDADVETGIDADTLDWYMDEFYSHNPKEQKITDHTEFLLKWNFVRYEQDTPVLTRGAIMLFGKAQFVRRLIIRPVLDYQRIDARYENWSLADRWHDRVLFEENLFATWRGLMDKYLRLADHPFRLDPATMQRIDEPLDFVAFRETAINLLMHQDYRDGRMSTMRWFTDRMQFQNPGDAFGEILLESNPRKPRNPLIVDAFRRAGLGDQAGTGITKISKNLHELGWRPPQIENDKIDKVFNVILSQEPLITEPMREIFASMGLPKEQMEILAAASAQGTITKIDAIMAIGGDGRQVHTAIDALLEQELLFVEGEGRYILAESVRDKISEQGAKTGGNAGNNQDLPYKNHTRTIQEPYKNHTSLKQIVQVLHKSKKEMTRNELQKALKLENRGHFLQEYLQPALDRGLIEMTLPDRPTSKKQKYRLTELGRSVAEELR